MALPKENSFEGSWFYNSDNMKTDWAAELGYLMDNASDPTNEKVNQAIASALIERMRKQQKLGQEIYDETNARALRWLENAGYTIDGGTEFDMEPFSKVYDDTGNVMFGAGDSLMDQWNPEPERFGWNGGWVDQDENGNGGYYVPAGKYSEQEWEQALADAMLYGRAGSGNMDFLQMRQDQQQEPYDPNQPMQRTRQHQGETLVYQPGRGYVRPEEPAAEVPQTPSARNGTPNWTSERNPYIDTIGNARDQGSLPQTVEPYTDEELLAMWQAQAENNDPNHYSGYAGPVQTGSYGSGYGSGYGGGFGDNKNYLSALDALVRRSAATGGLTNSNAVTAGQRVLTSAKAPEWDYAKYLKALQDNAGRYKNITKKRELY